MLYIVDFFESGFFRFNNKFAVGYSGNFLVVPHLPE
jgi:hypothetical protein